MPRYLSATDCHIQDPICDVNYLMSALLICIVHSKANFVCFMLRGQINHYYYSIPTDIYLALFLISEWAHDNLREMGRSVDKFDNPCFFLLK